MKLRIVDTSNIVSFTFRLLWCSAALSLSQLTFVKHPFHSTRSTPRDIMPTLRTLAEQLPKWLPSLAGYGAAAGGTLVYFTEWRAVCDYIPFYNTKFTSE